MRRTRCLSLSLLVLLSLFSPYAYAEDGVVTIGSVEDLIRFSEACKVESYSAGKVFSLTADLDLTDSGFAPVSCFAGTFRGNSHTISGLSIGGDGSRQGLFRRTSASAVISDLRVQGSVTPGGTGMYVGGVVGENNGKLTGCRFDGSISGVEAVGGVVGRNTASGQVQSCGFHGEIHGEHQIGGIVGWNEGSVSACTNDGAVNTVPVTPQEQQMDLFNLSLLDVSSVTSDDFLDLTDIGGICGENGGVVSACRNSGAVGYPNTAYNVGGIVGKTTGFVTDCENTGPVQGRKDVGGIAGQLIPYTELDLSKSKLDALRGEINALKELIAVATRDANDSAAWIVGDLNNMDQAVGWVLSLLGQYADALDDEDWLILDRIQEAIQYDPETGELILDPSVRYDEATGEYWFGDDIRFNPQTGQIWKDGVPEDFTTVHVRLLCEGEIVETRALPFGAALGTLPEIPNRDAWYWVWDASTDQRIYRSIDLTGSYQMPIEALATGEEPPEFLAEGRFYSGQVLTVTPVELENRERLIRAVTLCVDGFEGQLTVRMLTSEGGELFVLYENGTRESLSWQRDGRYIVFAIQNGESIVYIQAEKPSINPRVILLAAFSALGVLLIVLFLLRRRKGRGKPKSKKMKRLVK